MLHIIRIKFDNYEQFWRNGYNYVSLVRDEHVWKLFSYTSKF